MFEIFKSDKSGEFYFRLKARNSQTILSSEGYKTKASCKKGIASVQKNSTSDSSFALHAAKNGTVYFTLEAKNGEIVGTSQMYKSVGGRKKGLASVIKNAAIADTRDLSE